MALEFFTFTLSFSPDSNDNVDIYKLFSDWICTFQRVIDATVCTRFLLCKASRYAQLCVVAIKNTIIIFIIKISFQCGPCCDLSSCLQA